METVKLILKKCDDEYLALLNYRNSPLLNGYSPAQLSMGRKLKTRTPCHPDELKPCIPEYETVLKKETEYRRKMQENYNRRHGVVQGAQFSKGDRVWIPDLKMEGTVVRHHETPRSLVIQTSKRQVRRNRRMIRRSSQISSPLNMEGLHAGAGLSEALNTSTMTITPPSGVPSGDERDTRPPESEEPVMDQEPPLLRRSQRTVKKPMRYIEEY